MQAGITAMGTIIIQQDKHPDKKLEDAEEIKLLCMIPPIDKVDESLNALKSVKYLSLSTNCIERMPALNNLSININRIS